MVRERIGGANTYQATKRMVDGRGRYNTEWEESVMFQQKEKNFFPQQFTKLVGWYFNKQFWREVFDTSLLESIAMS